MKELDKERQKAILKILNFIQDGGELEEAKKMFQAAFDQVDVAEITAAERISEEHTYELQSMRRIS